MSDSTADKWMRSYVRGYVEKGSHLSTHQPQTLAHQWKFTPGITQINTTYRSRVQTRNSFKSEPLPLYLPFTVHSGKKVPETKKKKVLDKVSWKVDENLEGKGYPNKMIEYFVRQFGAMHQLITLTWKGLQGIQNKRSEDPNSSAHTILFTLSTVISIALPFSRVNWNAPDKMIIRLSRCNRTSADAYSNAPTNNPPPPSPPQPNTHTQFIRISNMQLY